MIGSLTWHTCTSVTPTPPPPVPTPTPLSDVMTVFRACLPASHFLCKFVSRGTKPSHLLCTQTRACTIACHHLIHTDTH